MQKEIEKKFGPLKNGNLISIAILKANVFWSTNPHPCRSSAT